MRCVARVPWMYSIISLSEILGDREALGRDDLEIEEGAWVEVPASMADWPADYRGLAERTLGRPQVDPRHYKKFKDSEEAGRAGFEATGLTYGGAYRRRRA